MSRSSSVEFRHRRRDTFKANGHGCVFCESKDRITVDHILPTSWGGERDSIKNTQPLCLPCSQLKARHEMEIAALVLQGNRSKEWAHQHIREWKPKLKAIRQQRHRVVSLGQTASGPGFEVYREWRKGFTLPGGVRLTLLAVLRKRRKEKETHT